MKQEILRLLGPNPGFTFFRKYFPNFKEGKNVKCPFHDDKNPSMSIMSNGGWRCFGATCGKHGDIFTFYGYYNRLDETNKKDFILILNGIVKDFNLSIQNQGHLDKYLPYIDVSRRKIKHPEVQNAIFKKKGWTRDTITKLGIGYSNDLVWFPIFNEYGTLVNIRKYDIFGVKKRKFMSIKDSFLPIYIFPYIDPNSYETVFIFKESDVPLARQIGIHNSFAITTGEGFYHNRLRKFFENKTVYITYDVDGKGIGGAVDPAISLAKQIYDVAKEIKICRVPQIRLSENKFADFSDFILMGQDFNSIIEDAEVFHDIQTKQEDLEYKEIHFNDCQNSIYYKKNIVFDALVIGNSLSAYIYPKKIRFFCDHGDTKKCESCGMAIHAGNYEYEFTGNPNEFNILKLVNINDKQLKGILRVFCGDVHKCMKLNMVVEETGNMEEIYITSSLDIRQQLESSVSTKRIRAFRMGIGCKANTVHRFKGTLVTEPATQQAINLMYDSNLVKSDIDNFNITQESFVDLKVFKPRNGERVSDRVNNIVTELSHRFQMVKREDVILGMLLTFLSPLSFNFNREKIFRGWIELLIIGDTGTGKSEIAKRLLRLLGVGTYFLCEKSTLSGLVGGVSYINGKKGIVVWGALPINDRYLVVLDEFSGLNQEMISKLTGVRDGIAASVTVEGEAKTYARTRKIVISNPRGSLPMERYTSGMEAIRKLVGNPEDISRFDFAICCGENEVSPDEINIMHAKPLDLKYTPDRFNTLVRFVWSRSPENYKFSIQTTRTILDHAKEMSGIYNKDFPIVIGSRQRLKLARISCAIAALMFSSKDGVNIDVLPEHADYARGFLDQIFSNPVFGYASFSKLSASMKINKTKVVALIKTIDNGDLFIENMISTIRFNSTDIRHFMDLPQDRRGEADDMLRKLLVNHCIKKVTNGYIKVPEFNSLLKDLRGSVAIDDIPF
jgi:hypothetical protein